MLNIVLLCISICALIAAIIINVRTWLTKTEEDYDFIKVCSTENPGFKSRDECRLKQTVFFELAVPFEIQCSLRQYP